MMTSVEDTRRSRGLLHLLLFDMSAQQKQPNNYNIIKLASHVREYSHTPAMYHRQSNRIESVY